MYRYDEFDHQFVRERTAQFRDQADRPQPIFDRDVVLTLSKSPPIRILLDGSTRIARILPGAMFWNPIPPAL